MRAVVALIACAAAAAVALAVAMPSGMFSGDEGIKLAEIQGLAFSDYSDGSLYAPGARFDEKRELDPFAYAPSFTFSSEDGAKDYGTYPLVYPAIVAPFYAAGGLLGAQLVATLAYILVLVLAAVLAQRCLGSLRATFAAVAVVAFACPMPLYACTLYEHVPASALLLGALVVATGPDAGARRLAFAGVLFGAATCLRTELYAFAPAMALVLAWRIGVRRVAWTRWLWFGAGAALVVGVFLVAHRLATPAWHPALRASADGDVPKLADRMGHVIAPGITSYGGLVVLATIAIAAAASLGGRRVRAVARVLAVGMAGAWIALAYLAIEHVDGRDIRTLVGLGTSVPVVALAALRGIRPGDRESPTGVLALASVAYIAAVVLLPKASANGGLELGARYLLPVVPPLVIAATDLARRHVAFAACWAVMVALGVCGTVVNASAEWKIRELGAHVVEAIDDAHAQAMFTEVWWVAQLAVPAQQHGVALYCGTKPTAIYDRLYDAGVRRIVSLRGSPPAPTGRVSFQVVDRPAGSDKRISPAVFQLVDARLWPAVGAR